MKVVQLARSVGGATALLALVGCASTPYEGKYEWSEGWREAEVIAVQTAADMERPRFYTCVRNATPEQLATTKFAVVKYRQMSRTQRRAVPLQAGEAVAVGESVYIKASRLQHAIGASRGPISAKPSQSANAPGGARRHDPAAHAAKLLDGGIGDQHLRAANSCAMSPHPASGNGQIHSGAQCVGNPNRPGNVPRPGEQLA